MNLTPEQVEWLGRLSDQWSFLWDKRRSLWIAAEDCPDGEQIEEADLEVLLTRAIAAASRRGSQVTGSEQGGSEQDGSEQGGEVEADGYRVR